LNDSLEVFIGTNGRSAMRHLRAVLLWSFGGLALLVVAVVAFLALAGMMLAGALLAGLIIWISIRNDNRA